MGISCSDFWEMSPRAVHLMQMEWLRRHEDKPMKGKKERSPGRQERRRLSYIPRP